MAIKILIILHLLSLCFSVRERAFSALSDEEYKIMIEKIQGRFSKPVNKRTKLEVGTLRKLYRWKNDGREIVVGASGASIYIDGKRIMRRKERDNLIKEHEKKGKDPGARKLTYRIKSKYIGCSERHIKTSRLDRNYMKVSQLPVSLVKLLQCCDRTFCVNEIRLI